MTALDPRAFGRSSAGWQLRAKLERRRSARRAALASAALAIASAAGAGTACAFDNCGGAALLALCAFAFLLVGIAAASEA